LEGAFLNPTVPKMRKTRPHLGTGLSVELRT
jgi:hypothetical protein